jgi:hypothetical protein
MSKRKKSVSVYKNSPVLQFLRKSLLTARPNLTKKDTKTKIKRIIK